MQKTFTQSGHCRARAHCQACQDPGERGRRFRLSLVSLGYEDLPRDGSALPCPFGMNPPSLDGLTADERDLLHAAKNPEGWGDHVAAAIHKMGVDRAYGLVRKTLGLVESCGGCNARREALNRLEGWVKGTFSKRPLDERQQEHRPE